MRLGLARDLVALAKILGARREAISLFEPGAVKRLAEQPEAGGLLAELAAVTWTPERVLRFVLQALQVHEDELAPRLIETQLVATLSKGIPGTARPTAQVLKEMLKPAPRDIVIVGYEVTDKDVVALLASAARAGGRITVICDRGKASGDSLLASWPADVVRPKVYQDRASQMAAKYAKMHGRPSSSSSATTTCSSPRPISPSTVFTGTSSSASGCAEGRHSRPRRSSVTSLTPGSSSAFPTAACRSQRTNAAIDSPPERRRVRRREHTRRRDRVSVSTRAQRQRTRSGGLLPTPQLEDALIAHDAIR